MPKAPTKHTTSTRLAVVPVGEPAAVIQSGAGGGIRFRSTDGVLCVRVRDFEWHADAVVDRAGSLELRIDDRHWYGLQLHDGIIHATAQIGDLRHELGRFAVPGEQVTLRIAATQPRTPGIPSGHAGPDDVILSVIAERGPIEIARLDGRYLSTEVAAGFTGRMLAVGAPTPDGQILRMTYQPHPT